MKGKRRSVVRALRAKGFTMVELMLIIGLIGVLLMLVAPRFQSYVRTGEYMSLKEKHKLVVMAIQDWSQDNKLNFQKPGDFEAKNSQGRTVPDYLAVQDFASKKDTSNNLYLEDEDCQIRFQRGVLITKNLKDGSISNIYTVFEAEDPDAAPDDIRLSDYEVLRGIEKYPSETMDEYNLRVKIKEQKKLILKEDNSLL